MDRGSIILVVLISVIIVGACFAGLAIGILLKKNGRFPETHIGRNREMAKRGIHCVEGDDYIERRNYKPVDTSTYTSKERAESCPEGKALPQCERQEECREHCPLFNEGQ